MSSQADAERKRDFMRFELSEINAAKPYPGEDEDLSQKLSLLQNSEKIYRNLSETYVLLHEASPSAADDMGKSLYLLQEIKGFSDEINSFYEVLSDAYYKIEIYRRNRKFKDAIPFPGDPGRNRQPHRS
jgi:DNA repair protein RecN (Recombination protein N)